MEKNQLEVLARIVLPSEILDYFEITSAEQSSTEIHIHLDELMNPALSDDVHFESKGFMEAVEVTDFPIRDHKVMSVPVRASASRLALTSPAREPVTPRSSGLF